MGRWDCGCWRIVVASVRGGRDESRRDSPTGGENRVLGSSDCLVRLMSLCDEIDLVVVDAGSGLTAWTRRFWLRAQCVVLVTTADDASVMDAYAAMKASSADGIRPMVRLLVNREINGAAAEDAQRRVQNACRKFLSLSIDALPALPLHEGDFVAGAHRGPRVWEDTEFGVCSGDALAGRAVGDGWRGDSQKDLETFGRRDGAGSETCAQQRQQTVNSRSRQRAIRLRCSCRQRTELRPINKNDSSSTPRRVDIVRHSTGGRCGSNWRNCGKFDGNAKEGLWVVCTPEFSDRSPWQ